MVSSTLHGDELLAAKNADKKHADEVHILAE